jgi:hypothetical protein
MGLGPAEMAVGDVVTVMRKAYLPILLRTLYNSAYHHIGMCFVLGLSNEEAVELENRGKLKLQTFTIE